MNEPDLPQPENADDHQIGNPRQNDGFAAPMGAAQLSSAPPSPALAGDILHGADAIAEFLYGDHKSRRKVYHLVEDGILPVFRLGINICARRSVLLSWIEAQERGPVPPRSPAQDTQELPR